MAEDISCWWCTDSTLDEGLGADDGLVVDVGGEMDGGAECPGGSGCPCQTNGDCNSNWCIVVDLQTGERRCTDACLTDDDCPFEWGCRNMPLSGGDQIFLCAPLLDPLCSIECLKDADCGTGNLCVQMESHTFCLRACEGDENCPDGYECKQVTNTAGDTTALQCVPVSGHCLCPPEVDYQSDPMHCGSCEHACGFPNGVPDCVGGECKMLGCKTGYFDLNHDEADGCEYECEFQGQEDLPDPDYVDSNCDGIDGTVDRAVFVDASTGDDDNVLGDMGHPFKTIGAALDFAEATDGKDQVYVSRGQYAEQVVLRNGISLYGGYDASQGWDRNLEENQTVIMWNGQEDLAVRAVVAAQIDQPTVLDGFVIKTVSATTPSASSYGIFVFHATDQLVISHNAILPGNGADGENGEPGVDGQPGQNGGSGTDAFEHDSKWCGICGLACNCDADPSDNRPGKGGASPCGNTGGDGGKGGDEDKGGSPGKAAANGGGVGGAPGGPTGDGKPGAPGAHGADGADGKGGKQEGDIAPSGMWVPGNGTDGQDGQNGTGGGGGGGGGGDAGGCCKTMGAAGGGGGGGGCAGSGGKGGSGGGSSFGIYIFEGSPKITGNYISPLSGGNGGKGGKGGKGGSGGKGGKGGLGNVDDAGAGGDGGAGGSGGNGGGGGGGAGGSSIGIAVFGGTSNPKCSDNTFEMLGFAGAGGKGGGADNDGQDGVVSPIYPESPSCKGQGG